jgi:hypothetical protein
MLVLMFSPDLANGNDLHGHGGKASPLAYMKSERPTCSWTMRAFARDYGRITFPLYTSSYVILEVLCYHNRMTRA